MKSTLIKTNLHSLPLIILLVTVLAVTGACGDDKGSSSDSLSSDNDDDNTDDDTAGDDDTGNDDDDVSDDDDNDDDHDIPDDYVAPWPQEAVESRDYDEAGDPGSLREKATAYDNWHLTWHQPDHGSCVHAFFTDDTYSQVSGYHGHGDSTMWTGNYLGSQALRYWITGNQQARQNAINKVLTLSGHLHVTARAGFIARFWGSQSSLTYPGDSWCDNNERCHKVDSGAYAGDWWIGETSRDQYIGWFYGMCLAYDLIDDEPTRQIIRGDMTEVLDELISTHFWIIDEAGLPTDAGPNVLPPMQLTWLIIGYHVTGLDRFKFELQKRLENSYRINLQINSITFFNRYGSYYGNNLAHTNWYNLLRLGRVYFSQDDFDFLLKTFENQVHSFTRLSHNPWFNSIFMGQGDYSPSKSDIYQSQLELDLETFRDPPLGEYLIPAKDPSTYTLDPVSVFLTDLQQQYPFLVKIMGEFHYQALAPFTVDQYCPAGFIFQWSPFNIDQCGADNPTKVHSGHDYLAAYWMASYHKFIIKSQ